MADLSFKKTEPTLKDLLDLHKRDILLSFNCHAIATVQSFDPAQQTVTAKMNYKKTVLKPDASGVYVSQLLEYPVLLDMPAVILRGGPASLTFPIQAGDNCLVLFNDRAIDGWFESGQIKGVSSDRLHSFSDGIALVGLSSLADPLADYDTSRAGLAWNQTMVKVSADKVKIANALYTLNTLLQNLVTEIRSLVAQTAALTVTCASPGSPSSVPINAALITAISVQLATTATQLGGLLE